MRNLRIDIALTDAAEAAKEDGLDGPELDQDAADFRAKLEKLLGEPATNDDFLVGVAVGAWALAGVCATAEAEGFVLTSTVIHNLSGLHAALVHSIRSGNESAAQFSATACP